MNLTFGGSAGISLGGGGSAGSPAAPPAPAVRPRAGGGGGGKPLTLPSDGLPSDKIAVAPRFAIEVKGMELATFSECSGIVATVRTDKLEEGGANGTTLKFPGRTDFGNVTLKHGVTSSHDLFDWFEKIVAGELDRRDVAVHVFNPGDSSESPMLTWWLINAFPVKWTAPSLQSTANSIALEAVEFAVEGLQRA